MARSPLKQWRTTAGRPSAPVGQDAHGVRVRVPIVDGSPVVGALCAKAKLGPECGLLHLAGGPVPVEIEADLADADDPGMGGQRL